MKELQKEKAMKTTDIKKIVSNQIDTMLTDGLIEQQITETVKKNILSAINSAISSYEIEQILRDKFKKEISQELGKLSFDEYTSKIIENVCSIINIESSRDLTDRVKMFYKDIFETKRKSIEIEEIIDRYIEYMTIKHEEDYKDTPDYASITIEKSGSYTDYYKVKLTTPTKSYSPYSSDEYKEKNEYYFELCISSNGINKNKIFMLYGENGKQMTNQFTYRYYSDFEKFLLNLYLNKTDVLITDEDLCDKEEYSLGDW